MAPTTSHPISCHTKAAFRDTCAFRWGVSHTSHALAIKTIRRESHLLCDFKLCWHLRFRYRLFREQLSFYSVVPYRLIHTWQNKSEWITAKVETHPPVAEVISGLWRSDFHACTRHEDVLSLDGTLFLCARAAAALILTKGLEIARARSKTRLSFACVAWIFIRFVGWINMECSPRTPFFI